MQTNLFPWGRKYFEHHCSFRSRSAPLVSFQLQWHWRELRLQGEKLLRFGLLAGAFFLSTTVPMALMLAPLSRKVCMQHEPWKSGEFAPRPEEIYIIDVTTCQIEYHSRVILIDIHRPCPILNSRSIVISLTTWLHHIESRPTIIAYGVTNTRVWCCSRPTQARGGHRRWVVFQLLTVLYSAPPIPAGIRSFQRNSGGIHRNSAGILQESTHSSGIPLEFSRLRLKYCT